MGAIAVSIFVSVVAVVGYAYFSYQDKKGKWYGSINHVWFCYSNSQCRRTLLLFSRQKGKINMGAIIMSVLVSVIAIVGVIYFNHQDKKKAQ